MEQALEMWSLRRHGQGTTCRPKVHGGCGGCDRARTQLEMAPQPVKLRTGRREEAKAVLTTKQNQGCRTPMGDVNPEGVESPKWLLGDGGPRD